jgi:hypothetical protein
VKRAARGPRARGGVALLACAVALAPSLGGCGGDSESDAPTGGDDRQVAPSPRERAGRAGIDPSLVEGFLTCLRRRGLDVPDDPLAEGRPPLDPQDRAVKEAIMACRSKLPAGIGPGSGSVP